MTGGEEVEVEEEEEEEEEGYRERRVVVGEYKALIPRKREGTGSARVVVEQRETHKI